MLDYLRIVFTGRSERGASAVEYGLLVVGVALGLFVVAPPLFDALGAAFVASQPDGVTNP
jgi:Flp pilus assembly pilin Flp